MPFKPRRYAKKRRYAGAKRRMMRPRIGPSQSFNLPRLGSVHRFKECVQISSISASGTSTGAGVMPFQINNLTNWPALQSLFDLYKLTGVKVKIIPRFNVSSPDQVGISGSQGGQLPLLYIAPNHDPYIPAPGSVGDILNDDGVKVIRMTKPVMLYLKNPKPDIRTPGSGDVVPFQFNSSSKKFQPWLCTGGNTSSVDQSTVKHYGYRWYIDNTGGPQNVVFDCFATYYFTMKEQD